MSGIAVHVRYPHGATESFSLAEGQVLRIGRHDGNDVKLPFNRVSRFHAVFSVVSGASGSSLIFSDLNSLNGSLVNGKRVATTVTLAEGDIITIADTLFRVELSGNGVQASDTGTTQSVGMEVIQASILVCDVRGYTTISENLPREEVAEMLQRWLEASTDVVEARGGEIDKYIGDSAMALWRGEERVRQALTAAEEILQATQELTEFWPHENEYPWRCKISLNCGEVLFGIVGGGEARKVTVLGDVVNVVFRLNDLASELGCELLLGREAALGSGREVRFVSEVQVQGRSEPVEVYTLR